MNERMKTLENLLNEIGVSPAPAFYEDLLIFENLLLETNRTLNLTAITDPAEILKKHYWDSLYSLSLSLFPQGAKVIDVGCGAGFPSIPLKLARRDLQITMTDSLQKRLNFIESVMRTLDLSGAETLHARAEDAGREPALRERYDIAVSRAVAELNKLCEYCLPFVKQGGILIAYKGANAVRELQNAENAIAALGGAVRNVYPYTLPGMEDRRALIVIEKTGKTPDRFPRAPKQIKEKPL